MVLGRPSLSWDLAATASLEACQPAGPRKAASQHSRYCACVHPIPLRLHFLCPEHFKSVLVFCSEHVLANHLWMRQQPICTGSVFGDSRGKTWSQLQMFWDVTACYFQLHDPSIQRPLLTACGPNRAQECCCKLGCRNPQGLKINT